MGVRDDLNLSGTRSPWSLSPAAPALSGPFQELKVPSALLIPQKSSEVRFALDSSGSSTTPFHAASLGWKVHGRWGVFRNSGVLLSGVPSADW